MRDSRFRSVCRAAGALMRVGHFIFSPIAHTHPIALECDLPTDFAFWENYDTDIILRCDAVWILTLDGWRESKGVTMENEIADNHPLPVSYVNRVPRSSYSQRAMESNSGAPVCSEYVYVVSKHRPLDIEAAD